LTTHNACILGATEEPQALVAQDTFIENYLELRQCTHYTLGTSRHIVG